ncbi:MAG: hypothetical protein ABS96_25240 [Lysobacteraceae bacterium SCN 69-123]|uniref:DUF4381 domain-containing protein n=1 Tax=Stenotrophomonas acidaminiphila TaxID=128780 RepID=UPI00086D45A9|nr:DUF4381 domain-containing protein [Stenotrophomonas acidaminiphila]MBN8801774.1 DUF4381 domain-containing protein [Stenotrophomonas acidaminiphila]MDF9441984.1 DUF4381 domain-containing protein [Stenotrophomonas acidaminiphila]ODU43194.1 MAG: hypothetical protein ABS96_25240 [Xanthomonadaceae bacterium SCN 69-123]OJY79473.1 MAG: hypothetical protein BGP18_01520 [Stenotrophomonas sp. 69-14]
MNATTLPLRDVHLPAAPGGWPPAPGWWLLSGALLLGLGVLVALRLRRRRRRRRWQSLFDGALAAAPGPAARLGMASELLRRAARRSDPDAALLQGEAWLQFLDGGHGHDFSTGDGRMLLDGGFRRAVDEAHAARACALARGRFIGLMERRR